MKPIPGGQLALQDIIGRDALIEELKGTLATQSVLMVAERRVGKTHVLAKLKAQAPRDWIVVYRDMSATRSAAEFVQNVMEDLYPHLKAQTNFRNWLQGLGEQMGGTQLGPVKLPSIAPKHWKRVLGEAIEHLEAQDSAKCVVFLWDELPWMLQAIAQTNPQDAMELLDTLRTLRQRQATKLRMVFTGSLGLHHIVRVLKAQGYNNTPVNDMFTLEVPALDLPDARDLLKRLFDDNQLHIANPKDFDTIANSLDCLPFYIHHLVAALLKSHSPSHPPLEWVHIKKVITQGIHSINNPWDLQHYEERTQPYYSAQRGEALALLDAVASAGQPLTMKETIQRAKASNPAVDEQQWLELTRLLERDHYFVRTEANTLQFKFSVVQRWWLWHRGLQMVQTGASA